MEDWRSHKGWLKAEDAAAMKAGIRRCRYIGFVLEGRKILAVPGNC
jgi:hypothetical protein